MSGVGGGVGRGVAVARSASKVGFGVTVATRLGTVGLGASETSDGSGVAVGRVSTTISSGWMRGVAVGAEDWQAIAVEAQMIAHITDHFAIVFMAKPYV